MCTGIGTPPEHRNLVLHLPHGAALDPPLASGKSADPCRPSSSSCQADFRSAKNYQQAIAPNGNQRLPSSDHGQQRPHLRPGSGDTMQISGVRPIGSIQRSCRQPRPKSNEAWPTLATTPSRLMPDLGQQDDHSGHDRSIASTEPIQAASHAIDQTAPPAIRRLPSSSPVRSRIHPATHPGASIDHGWQISNSNSAA
ncbi:hypothetical protein ACLOJK_023924 [Asimina triloba]